MQKKKALIVANTGRFIALFERNNIGILQHLGYEVHCFSNFHEAGYEEINQVFNDLQVIQHDVDSFRSPYRLENIKIYRQLKSLMQKEQFQLVDCHTPMGGVLARLAAKATGTGPVLYTAHGFHFFKGCPLKNWLLYYPVERRLSRSTDIQLTINREDYERAQTFHAGKVVLIPGVGFDVKKFEETQTEKKAKRAEFGIPEDAFLILSVGELIPRKNHIAMIRSIAKLKEDHPYYLICGEGPLRKSLEKEAERLNLRDRIIFAGFRTDIHEILEEADCFAFPSRQEGLSVALLEAMAVGLPVVCSRIRGNADLIEEGKGGYLLPTDDFTGYAGAIRKLARDETLKKRMGAYNREAVQKYDVENVGRMMKEIYISVGHSAEMERQGNPDAAVDDFLPPTFRGEPDKAKKKVESK